MQGDWLTAWTLLDLFLLLIFSLAVFRLWGIGPALLAFVAFGLSYHEPGAPRYLWLVLLVPLALLRVRAGRLGAALCSSRGKWITIAVFVLVLVPFVARQVQQALYPQLEDVSGSSSRMDSSDRGFGAIRGGADHARLPRESEAAGGKARVAR